MTTKLERSEHLHFANERYATSSGFGFSMNNLLKPSIIDATALGRSRARDDERGHIRQQMKIKTSPPKKKYTLYDALYFYRKNIFNKKVQYRAQS